MMSKNVHVFITHMLFADQHVWYVIIMKNMQITKLQVYVCVIMYICCYKK